MPVYEIQHPTTGQKIRLEGDGVPSDADIREAFNSVSKATPTKMLSGKEYKDARKKFIEDTGTFGTQVKEKALDVAREASPYVRPVVEGLAMGAGGVGGGALGAAAGGIGAIPGSVAGAGLGYAAGKNVMDTTDKLLGTMPVESAGQLAMTTGRDILTGGTMEAGGQVAGQAIAASVPYARRALGAASDALAPLTKGGATRTADNFLLGIRGKGGGQVSDALRTTPSDPLAVNSAAMATGLEGKEAANLAQSQALVARLQLAPEEMPSSGQMTGNFGQRYLEQGMTSMDKEFAAKLGATDQAAIAKATGNMQKAAGKGYALPDSVPAPQVGEGILGSIEEAQIPIKKRMEALEANIPDYTLKVPTLLSKIDEIQGNPKIATDAKNELEKIRRILETRAPGGITTTHEAMGIRRDINNAASKAFDTGNDSAGAALTELRDALQSDVAKLGEMGRTGKAKIYKGQPVDTDKLAAEFEDNLGKLAELSSRQTPDQAAMVDFLKQQGIHPSIYGKVDRYDTTDKLPKIIETYKRLSGQEPPVAIDAASRQHMANLQKRNQIIQDILKEASPGQDVGAAVRAYNNYASKEWFGRFDRGDVERVLRKGNEINGRAMKSENVASQFMSPESAGALIKAVGPEQARAQMLPHLQNQMRQFSISAEGEAGALEGLDVRKMMQYIDKNLPALKRYQMDKDAYQMVRDSVPDYLKVKLASKNLQTPAAAKDFVNSILPGLRKAGYTSEQVQAFRDFRATIDMLARNKNVSYSGNSTTIEKSQAIKQIDEKLKSGDSIPGLGGRIASSLSNGITMTLAGGGAFAGSHGGPMGISAGAALGSLAGQATSSMLKNQSQIAQQIFLSVLREAAYNPAYTKVLVDAAKAGANKTSPELAKVIAETVAKIGTLASVQPEQTKTAAE